MPSLRDDGGNVGIRDHRSERALQLACGGALSVMGAFAGVTLLRPDLVSLDAPAFAPASLVLGLTGLATLGLVSTLKRMNHAAPPSKAASGIDDAAEHGEQGNASARESGEGPMHSSVNEMAEAIVATRISRLLLLGPAGEKAAEAVALARRLAGRGDPTVLVDFDGGRTVGDLGLLPAVESIAHVAASPTTFAHSIHRDRSSRTHIMAARLDSPGAGPDAAKAVASVLATLEEVYARVVAILPADAELVASLVHKDTAIAVPGEAMSDAVLGPVIERLAVRGVDEVIALTDEKPAVRPKVALARVASR